MFDREQLLSVTDRGEVASFRLPVDWVEGDQPPSLGGHVLYKFHPINSPDARFCIHIRELELSRPASEAFQQTIYSKFHDLGDWEIQNLAEVLESMGSEGFRIKSASTGYLRERRALRVVGTWVKQQLESIAFFIDVEGDGSHVQQIYFCAPPAQFESFRADAEEIFNSIQWKRHTEN